MSTAVLLPMNSETQSAIQEDKIKIEKFPFRIGRESRREKMVKRNWVRERRKKENPPNNDLYLKDEGDLFNVSREHFQIEAKNDGTYELVDRGSTCGTIVADHIVGGRDKGGRYPLKNENIIVIGTFQSPFIFKFLVLSE
jgi:pSer/pThr/pTyr-binding forkhead associated (FHA) protein